MSPFYLIPSTIRFFKNLHLPRSIQNLQYEFRGKAIVYAIRCQITNMVYVGSTLVPGRRFSNHLVTGYNSNEALQVAIAKHGLSRFTAYVFEVVEFPAGLSLAQKRSYLRAVEQTYIDRFPAAQLYNYINSSNS